MRTSLERDRQRHQLRIIVPAKDEAARIEATLVEYCGFFRDNASVVVVANGCTDETVAIVNRLRERFSNLSMLVVDAKIGKGGAVRAGLTIGHEPYIAYVDADGSTRAEQLQLLLDICIERGAAGAIGSRWLPGSTIARRQPLKRRVASRAFNTIVRFMFDLPFYDTQCGAKVFSRTAIDSVLEKLEIANFAFDVDLLHALRKLKRTVIEVPIAWSDVPEASQVKLMKSGSGMLLALLRLWIRHSPLRNLPFLDMLARSSVIPVKNGLRVLMLRTRRHNDLEHVADEFKRQGHEITIFDLKRSISYPNFTWWYLSYGHRTYDIILDCTRGPMSSLVAMSAKPKLTAASISSLGTDDLAKLVDQTARRCGYTAMLWRHESGWILTSALLQSSLLEQI